MSWATWGRSLVVFLFVGVLGAATLRCEPPRRVTIDLPAAPLSRLLPEIGKKCGMDLTAGKSTAADVVVVKVTDAAASELMDRIAWAVGAEWVKKGDAYELQRSAAEDRRQRNQTVVGRAGLLAKALDHAGGNSHHAPDPLHLAILRQIDVKQLLSLPQGERIVYSTAPNEFQVAMPSGLRKAIDAYVAQVLKTAPTVGPIRKQAGTPVKVLLEISTGRQEMEGSNTAFYLDVVPADAEGVIRRCAGIHLSFPPESGSGVAETKVQNSTLLVFDRNATEFGEIIRGACKVSAAPKGLMVQGGSDYALYALTSDGRRPQAVDQWKDRLLAPDKFEPLAWLAGPAFAKAADALGDDLVACLPDWVMVPTAEYFASPREVGALIEEAQTRWRMKVTRKGGWLCMRPIDLPRARDRRSDRAALGRFAAALNSKGVPGLDDVADYATCQPLGGGGTMGMAWLHCFNPAISEQGCGIRDLAQQLSLRFYGSLSTADRHNLVSGGSLRVRSLAPSQKSLLAYAMSNSLMSVMEDPGPSTDGQVLSPRILDNGRASATPPPLTDHPEFPTFGSTTNLAGSLLQEPTEWFAGPWAADAVVTTSEWKDLGALVRNGRSNALAFATCDQLAGPAVWDGTPYGSEAVILSFDTYTPAERATFDLRLQFGGRYSWCLANLVDYRVPAGAKSGAAADLPEALKKKIDLYRRGRTQ